MLRIHGDTGKSVVLSDIQAVHDDSFVVQYVKNHEEVSYEETFIVNSDEVDWNDLCVFIKEEIDNRRKELPDYIPTFIIIYSQMEETDNNFECIAEELTRFESNGYCRRSIFMYK